MFLMFNKYFIDNNFIESVKKNNNGNPLKFLTY